MLFSPIYSAANTGLLVTFEMCPLSKKNSDISVNLKVTEFDLFVRSSSLYQFILPFNGSN